MEIRKIRKDEADDISRIYAASWKNAYRGIVEQSYLDQLSELRWSHFLAENSDNSFVLIEKGQYVGASSINPARMKK